MAINNTMPNNYFQFKQFTIYQHQCAMKVTTDGCLFGAWVAEQVATNKQTYPGNNTLLDIGTGTGLLSLMLAQKTDCMIDAIEMEENAFQQALSNAAQSPWNSRIKITQADARTFSAEKKYDCIISNPPFFENQLASPDARKNKALHAHELSMEELFTCFKRNIHPQGTIFLLMPAYRREAITSMATKHDFFIHQAVMVKQTPSHEPFRIMLQLGGTEKQVQTTGLMIREMNNDYSQDFVNLLKDYYLHL
jgi:tRNA1Val (adenine37-N6)-methyltransferase